MRNKNLFIFNIFKYKDLIKQTMFREVSIKYKGSYLGFIWSILNPLVMLLVYTFVFGVVFQSRWGVQVSTSKAEFALTLFSGIITYTIFSEIVNRAPNLIVTNPNYVKKVIFPLEILSISNVGSVLIHSSISLGILILGMGIFMHIFNWTIIFYPIVILPLVMFSLGLSWLLSALGVYIRDMGYTCVILTQILFYMTPVFYPISSVPQSFQKVMYLNPITVIVESGRDVLMWGRMPNWTSLGAVGLVSFIMMILCYKFFMKTKSGFADVL